jgi:hypothetical protein
MFLAPSYSHTFHCLISGDQIAEPLDIDAKQQSYSWGWLIKHHAAKMCGEEEV